MNAREPSWRPGFFSQGHWNRISVPEIRESIRSGLTRWGLPEALRVDNGYPWGSKGELPTDLALWLIGLGIRMVWNPPRQPQKNGVVERAQGTGKRWSEPGRCRTVQSLQKRVDEMDRVQRDEYLVKGGFTRRDLFPELRHSARPYRRTEEQTFWDWDRVAEHMAQYTVQHKVDSRGQVTIYKRNHYVGQTYAGRTIRTTFDPTTCEWIFRDLAGNQLRVRPAEELTKTRIMSLQVTRRRGQT